MQLPARLRRETILLKPETIAVGRKNYHFAGSHEAAQRAAMVYSLMATCNLHHINPYHWLKDVLEQKHLFTTSNIEQLLPQNWRTLHTMA